MTGCFSWRFYTRLALVRRGIIGSSSAFSWFRSPSSLMAPPFGFFRPQCRLRQGDSLSPFLFVLVTKVLTKIIKHEEARGSLHGIKITRHASRVTNVLFADDIMFFYHANQGEVWQLQQYIKAFARWSGQVINLQKSFLHFSNNLSPNRIAQFSTILCLQPASLPGCTP